MFNPHPVLCSFSLWRKEKACIALTCDRLGALQSFSWLASKEQLILVTIRWLVFFWVEWCCRYSYGIPDRGVFPKTKLFSIVLWTDFFYKLWAIGTEKEAKTFCTEWCLIQHNVTNKLCSFFIEYLIILNLLVPCIISMFRLSYFQM